MFAGKAELGAAWKKARKDKNDYLSVKLDGSSFPAAIKASRSQ